LTGFGSSSIEVELSCYALTRARTEYLEIREDVLLKAMEIVERSGTRLALPTEVH
jgi:MscS family membrane protein